MLEFKQAFGIEGYNLAKELRREVFIKEQKIGYEYDEYDDVSWHIVGYDKDTVIGTARMYKVSDSTYKIGRMAVKKEYRRQYIGDLLIKTLQDKIVTLGGREAVVEAQAYVKDFYLYEGYTQEGDEYILENIPHVKMTLDLSKPKRHCCVK